ncbi:MAG TPA: aminomethyltransferase family protein [Gemmatimonadaceae bacterium]|nr:aminomethyltransferase family protein [Gemmatimonadaceae bacterium]
MLKTTPFHVRTSALSEGQSWRRWAGYVAASAYELTHDHEYAAIRNAAALLDITPLFKYHIEGRDAVRLLDRLVTRDVAACRVGQVLYTPWCDASGKIIDDGTLARLGEDRFRLTCAEPNLRWLTMNSIGLDVRIEDVSDRIAALALQGPTSRAVLDAIVDDGLDALRFFRITNVRIRGRDVAISRTGYTGDLGFELWMDNADAERVWDALIEGGAAHGITPTGLLALDVARIEAGLILLGVDYVPATRALIPDQFSSPFELGLGWTVKLDKAPFVGQNALRDEHARGSLWSLVGLEIDWDSLERLYAEVGLPPRLAAEPWRTSIPVYAGGRQIGYGTSGCWSPLLKKPLALAHVERAHAAPGTTVMMEVTVEHRRRQAVARVAKTPFFDPERKRA